jgi:hypothetical protein
VLFYSPARIVKRVPKMVAFFLANEQWASRETIGLVLCLCCASQYQIRNKQEDAHE